MLCFCTWHFVILMWFSIMAGKLVLNKSLNHYVRPRPNVELFMRRTKLYLSLVYLTKNSTFFSQGCLLPFSLWTPQ